jgi:polar amino acid transport system substrate-binding protein
MNNITKTILLVVVVVLVVSFVGVRIFSNEVSQNQNLLAKVLDKGEIRVGYVIYPPGMIKDANTGKLSGIFHDALEEAGKNLGLKINWVEEVGWGTMIEGLNSGRYDMIGSAVWPTATRAKNVDFTIPLNYGVIGVYVRSDDSRFINLDKINSESVTLATIDGEISSFVAKEAFPQAKVLSLPQDTQISLVLLNVTTRKADVAFVEPAVAEEFLANNPNTIKNIAKENPIRTYGNTWVVSKNESAFKNMLDVAIQELQNNGKIDELVEQYSKYPGSFYPVSKPYNVPR